MSEDLIFARVDIEKYLKPMGLDKSLYELWGIIQLSKKLKGEKP